MSSAGLWVLRLLGLLAGLAGMFLVFRRLRRYRKRRFWDGVLALTAGSIVAIAVWPAVLDYPSRLLQFDRFTGGRLLLLSLGLAAMSWLLAVRASRLAAENDLSIDALVRAQALAGFSPRAARSSTGPAICVLIPALDEAENLRVLLPRVPAECHGARLEVVVIDDGSRDGTAAVVREAEAVAVTHAMNRGGGAALRTGYAVAVALQADIVVTMDADGQHDPEAIPRLVEPLLDDDADIVIGSRILGSSEPYSKLRLTGVRWFSGLINFLLGTTVTDCSSGFRAFRLSATSPLELVQDQFHTAELIIEASKRGLRIAEVPIDLRRRHSGESKKGPDIRYALSFARSILRTWLR